MPVDLIIVLILILGAVLIWRGPKNAAEMGRGGRSGGPWGPDGGHEAQSEIQKRLDEPDATDDDTRAAGLTRHHPDRDDASRLRLFTAQHHPNDRRSDVEIYREIVDLAVEAERIGLESVWTSEHHFVDDGYMPSQLRSSPRSPRVRSASRWARGALGPMFDPLHLAEDARPSTSCRTGADPRARHRLARRRSSSGSAAPRATRDAGSRRSSRSFARRGATTWCRATATGSTATRSRLQRDPETGTVRGLADLDRGRRAGCGRACRRIANGYISSGATVAKMAERAAQVRQGAEAAAADPPR
jgi:hypothetical protein